MHMQVGTEKVGEREIFRGLCHMQVEHMQLFSRYWTPALPIGSLREWIATDVPALLLGLKVAGALLGPPVWTLSLSRIRKVLLGGI
jgi:hypothetical protein